MFRRTVNGLDEMAVDIAFIGVSAIVAIVTFSWVLNSEAARRLDGTPIVGRALAGLRALVGQVTN